jgi:hypothetical protein
LPPKNIRIKNVATKSQNNVLWKNDNGPQISYFPKLYSGKINKIKIADTIAITPPNLSGNARRIA